MCLTHEQEARCITCTWQAWASGTQHIQRPVCVLPRKHCSLHSAVTGSQRGLTNTGNSVLNLKYAHLQVQQVHQQSQLAVQHTVASLCKEGGGRQACFLSASAGAGEGIVQATQWTYFLSSSELPGAWPPN